MNTTNDKAAVANAGANPKTPPKLPIMITHQVLVGLMNDILSNCTFLTLPEITGNVVQLDKTKAGEKQYMMVLRFEKKGIVYEVLSYDFAANIKDENHETEKQDESRATQLAVGIMVALREKLAEPTHFAKIQISMLNGYLNKTLNRGGMWAYMSLPCFLSGQNNDQLVLKERREKVILEAKNGIAAITGTAITALLWVIYYLKAEKILTPICSTLIKEFMQCHDEPQQMVNTMYMGSLMGYLSHEELASAAITNLNQVSILETLTAEELVLLLAAFNDTDALNMPPIKKVMLIFTEEVERLYPQCIASLLWTLVKLNYRFDTNTHFTRQMMLRLSKVFSDLPLTNRFLFSALAYVKCEMAYYDIILDSVMLKLHLMDHKEIIMIGASYAFASKIKLTKPELDIPNSEQLYDILEFYVNRSLTQVMTHNEILLAFVYESIRSDDTCNFAEKIAGSTRPSPRESLKQSAKKIQTRASLLGTLKHDSGSSDALCSANTPSNAFKLFYLNILEDCCVRYEQLDLESTCFLLFALLTFHIDIEPLYQAMLVTQGLMLRKRNNPVKIVKVTQQERAKQHAKAYEILQYVQNPNNPGAPLIIEGFVSQCQRLDQIREVQDEKNEVETQKNAQNNTDGQNSNEQEQTTQQQQTSPTLNITQTPKVEENTPSDETLKRQQDMEQLMKTLTAAIASADHLQQRSMDDNIRMCMEVLGTATNQNDNKQTTQKITSPRSAAGAQTKRREHNKNGHKDQAKDIANNNKEGGMQHSTLRKATGRQKNNDNIPYLHQQYCILYKIKTMHYHRAELIKRRVAIRYTYEKIKGKGR